MDTACVELKYSDGSKIFIDTIAVENEVVSNLFQRSELDWLIYNKPLEYPFKLIYSLKLDIRTSSIYPNTDIL